MGRGRIGGGEGEEKERRGDVPDQMKAPNTGIHVYAQWFFGPTSAERAIMTSTRFEVSRFRRVVQ